MPDVVEDEVFERHELALGPEGGAGLGGIGSGDDAGADRTFPQPLVEPGERVVGGRQRTDEVGERGGAKREGAGRWDRGGPGGPGFRGHRGSRCGTGKHYRINNNKSLTQVNKLCHCLTRTPPNRGSSPSIISDYRWGWGLGGSGRIWGFWGGVLGIRAQNRTPGGPWAGRILRSPPAQGEAPPLPFGPQCFFWPDVGLGRDLGGTGLSFLCRQDGAASIGATQRVKTIAFWAIYTYRNTYWRLKGSNAQKTHHHGRRGRL